MATPVTAICGQSLRTLGFYTQKTSDRYGGIELKWSAVALPGAAGAIVSNPRLIGPRRPVLVGAVLADSPDLLQGKLDSLYDLLLAGIVTLESGYLGRELDVVVDGAIKVDPIGSTPELRARMHQLTVPLLASFPYWTEKNWLPLSFGATRTQVKTGRAPSVGVITLRNGTNPVITYRDSGGNPVRTMGLTWTPGAGESVDIDLRPSYLQIQRRSSAGVLSAGDDLLTSGGFFAIDPQDGNPDLAIYPTLEVSTGSGVLLYAKAYP